MADLLEPVTASRSMPGVDPDAVYAVLTDFEHYPSVFPEVARAQVRARRGEVVEVAFELRLVVPVRYVLALRCDAQARTIDWSLVEGEVVCRNDGGWRVHAEPSADGRPGTRVEYRVAVAVEAPLPSFVLRRLVDGLVRLSLPTMFDALARATRPPPVPG